MFAKDVTGNSDRLLRNLTEDILRLLDSIFDAFLRFVGCCVLCHTSSLVKENRV